jgi:Ca2+-binding EF-hand superfamily protein
VEEAFKSFDRDFDGCINKEDLRWGLLNVMHVKPEEIMPTKLDRLFKLMDFYKTNTIQLSDFQRLMSNENPYSASQGSRVT